MKKLVLLLALFSTAMAYGQSFEGTLTYVPQVELSPKLAKMGMTKEWLVNKLKEEGSWADTICTSYKGGNYCTVLNNTPKSWSTYKAETNKIYALQEGEAADICIVTDASIDLEFKITGKQPSVQKLDTAVSINGTPCEVVRVKWKSGTYDYYYSPSRLQVDPSLFARHVFDGWASFLQISRALPLRIVKTTNGMMTITMDLVAIDQKTVDERLFSLPTMVADKDLNPVPTGNKEVMRVQR